MNTIKEIRKNYNEKFGKKLPAGRITIFRGIDGYFLQISKKNKETKENETIADIDVPKEVIYS